MKILGIDPGTTAIGYAILEGDRRDLRLHAAHLISITGSAPEERLRALETGIAALIREWKPEVLAIERLFFNKNQKTALAVAEARGVILLTATTHGLKVYEYTPLQVKKTVTGDGKADKRQVQKMVRVTLGASAPARARDDVFDAIAIALTCVYLAPRETIFHS